MSHAAAKRTRIRSRTTASNLPGEPGVQRVGSVAEASAVSYGWGGGQGYGMADWSPNRGYIYFPQLDTKKEVTPYTRTEGLRKARFLDANVGLARRLLNGMGRMAMGTGLMPMFTTRDREWNKLMNRRIEQVFGSALTYDLAGKADFYSTQAQDMTAAYRDGDLGKAYARDEGGNLRVAYYEGHQIGGALPGITDPRIFDGVRVDRHNRTLGYIIQAGDQAGEAVEIDAANFALLCNQDRKGATRATTVLRHAINKMVDRGELEQMTSKGMKNAQRIGFALTRAAGSPPKPPGWNGGTGANPMRKESVTAADGTTKRVKIEDVVDSGGGEVPELPEGMDIKTLLDTRPHPNTMEFFDYIARDAAMGCDWPHELLYSIWKLGGANMRYVMADAASIIEREQQRWIQQYGTRDVIAFAVEEMRTGRVRKCQDPEWWAHEFIPPARMTVDFGRDGALYLKQIQSGALTFKRYFGWQGLGIDQLDHWMDEAAYVKQGAIGRGLDPAFVLGQLYGKPGGVPLPTDSPNPDDAPPAPTPGNE